MAQTAQFHRRYARVRLRGSAQLNTSSQRYAGELSSLSFGGAFISGVPPIEEGTEVQLHLLLPKVTLPVTTRGKVLYNLPSQPGHRAGMGIGFTALDDESLCRLDHYLYRTRELHLELLHRLAEDPRDLQEIRSLCLSAGLPPHMSPEELYAKVESTLLALDGVD